MSVYIVQSGISSEKIVLGVIQKVTPFVGLSIDSGRTEFGIGYNLESVDIVFWPVPHNTDLIRLWRGMKLLEEAVTIMSYTPKICSAVTTNTFPALCAEDNGVSMVHVITQFRPGAVARASTLLPAPQELADLFLTAHAHGVCGNMLELLREVHTLSTQTQAAYADAVREIMYSFCRVMLRESGQSLVGTSESVTVIC